MAARKKATRPRPAQTSWDPYSDEQRPKCPTCRHVLISSLHRERGMYCTLDPDWRSAAPNKFCGRHEPPPEG